MPANSWTHGARALLRHGHAHYTSYGIGSRRINSRVLQDSTVIDVGGSSQRGHWTRIGRSQGAVTLHRILHAVDFTASICQIGGTGSVLECSGFVFVCRK